MLSTTLIGSADQRPAAVDVGTHRIDAAHICRCAAAVDVSAAVPAQLAAAAGERPGVDNSSLLLLLPYLDR